MPNAIIATSTNIITGSAHLHYKCLREMEDKVAINGTTKDDAGDKEEDVVGDNRVPKECQRMLLWSCQDQKWLHLMLYTAKCSGPLSL